MPWTPEDRAKYGMRSQLRTLLNSGGITEDDYQNLVRAVETSVADFARECYRVAGKVLSRIEEAVDNRDSKDKWLHTLNGTLKIVVEVGQLVSGKPTVREENIARSEQELMERIDRYADIYNRLAERGRIVRVGGADHIPESVDSN